MTSRIFYKIKNKFEKQNTQHYWGFITTAATDLLSVAISNLALWFIPQSVEYELTIINQLPNLKWYVILIIIMNLSSLFCFLVLYYIEFRREYWLIHTFDYSKRYDSMHLTKYKNDYPDIFTKLEQINRHYYMIYYITKWILYCNIVISSSVIIANNNWTNYKTYTTLFTNFWISYSKISRGLHIAKESITYGIGIAYYNTLNLHYNRIDPRIKRHQSNSNINSHVNSQSQSQPSASRLNSRRSSVQNSNPESLNASISGNFQGADGNIRPIPTLRIDEGAFMEDKII